ncbi:MAG: sigma-E factor negative regulatory protein [Pseudomonadota bacterium]
MKHTEMTREQVSALVDGQLHGDEFAQAIGEIDEAEELRSTWATYHLIGDVLRSGAHAPCTNGTAFMSKLQQRLAQENIAAMSTASLVVDASPMTAPRIQAAANEPVFRWKLVAGAASLAAAAAIGWNWVGSAGVPSGPQLAQQQGNAVLAVADAPRSATAAQLEPNQVLIGNRPQVMLRDPRLDQLLEAHQQAGGASQMPSGFLRNATFEGPSR